MVVIQDQENDGVDSMNEDEDVRVEVDGRGDQNGIYEEAGEPAAPAAPMDPKQEKAEKKRLEKEEKKRKEEEKRQLKEQEKRFKAAANGGSATNGETAADVGVASRKQERDQKKQSGLASFFSPLRPGVRPKNAVRGRVLLLDGSEIEVEIEKDAKAKVLVDKICDYVNIFEKDYFSCLYNDAREGKYWLIEDRRIVKQIGNGQWLFEFAVKFYPPEPTILQEDITRYQLCLQLRDDILSGRVPCSPVANALLGACTVQSELGDYDAAEHGVGIDYIQDIMFAPGQTDELLAKIAEMHRTQMRGRTPAEAELMYLENAKKLELYGIHLQQSKDIELFDILVGVSATGIHVYRDRLRVSRFPWPKVLKMSYKAKTFYIKIRPGECERFENTIGFKMLTHNLAKRFWRLAMEHHTFFRLKVPSSVADRSLFARFGSSRSRYSGRTLYQSRIWSSTIDRVGPAFERTLSQRSLASRSLNNSSFMDRDDKRRTASMDRTGRRGYDDYQQDYGEDRQVAVVAGTAADANRVAYVKTVRPGSPSAEQHQQFDQTPGEHYTNETFRYEPDDLSPLSTDVSQMQIGADGTAIPKRKKKKKKKTTANGSRQTSQRVSAEGDGTNYTETQYRTERDGVVETRVERRLVVNGQDVDHDYELSKAITNVTNMDADLSVEKIEINPSDVAKSMTGAGGGETIAIAPAAGVKKKKKKTSTKHREPVAQLA